MIKRTLTLAVLTALMALAAGPAAGQDLLLSLDATVGGFSCAQHLFGWRGDALTGEDPYDIPEPPLPPDTFLALAFRLPGPAPDPNRWRTDIRATSDFLDRTETWEVEVETSLIAGSCQMDVGVVSGTATGLVLRIGGLPSGELIADIPGPVVFDLTGDPVVLVVEVVDETTPVSRETWGSVQCLFR